MTLYLAGNMLCNQFSKLRLYEPIKIFTRTRKRLVQPKERYPWWFTRRDQIIRQDLLTSENEEFIKEVIKDKYEKPPIIEMNSISPLKTETLPQKGWTKFSQRVGLIARKIGVYPLYTKDGKWTLTTLLQVADNHVIKYTPPEEYINYVSTKILKPEKKKGCLLVGADSIDPTQISAKYSALFSRSGVMPKRFIHRFLVNSEAALPAGTPLYASHFRVGDIVDIRGKTIDRGFQGVMKRWGFKGMPATHGVTKTHRRPGCIGGGGEKGRVWPGTKLPGHMGNKYQINRGCQILRINNKYNVLWVKSVAIPGVTGSLCYLYDTALPLRKPETAPPFPTYYPSGNEEEEIFHESVHNYNSPSITFPEE